ncbi:hypothetical protein TKK_0010118 [Trichogramma kaykai]|uniref:COMM domain-containing protein n=1 Tax=Trichogramma kaykai TaxID=54128 RepID=A0ABD2WY68_9HYME
MEFKEIENCILFAENNQVELLKFVHSCMDEVCNLAGPTYKQFKQIGWSKEEFKKVHTFFITLFYNPACLFIDDEKKMPFQYQLISKHVKVVLLKSLRLHRNQITDSLLQKYSSKHFSTLDNYDWRLKYIMGSSKMISVKEPLLQLDLSFHENRNHKVLELELNKTELNLLINTIETAVS